MLNPVGLVLLLIGLGAFYFAYRRRHTTGIIAAIVGIIVIGLVFFKIELEPIHLAGITIFMVGPIPITNAVLATWLTMAVLVLLAWLATRNMQQVPHGLQNFFELIIDGFRNLTVSVTGSQDKANAFLPLILTLFLFIITANWIGLIPGVTAITVDESVLPKTADSGHALAPPSGGDATLASTAKAPGDAAEEKHHGAPLFKPATTDLNMTLALAVVSVFMAQYWGIKYLGLNEYRHKFFTARGGPIMTFVGIVEFISEIAKIVSFSFRLFGNIFAGEVLLIIFSYLVPFGLTLPFLGLELFVGFIQAFVFAMLTLVFLASATTGHGHEDHAHGDGHGAPASAHH